MFPEPSKPTPPGPFSCALVAGPPSRQASVPTAQATLGLAAPATVVIVPAGFTSRIALSLVSAMKMLPVLSTKTPSGELSSALVAGLPSPQGKAEHATPLPATVKITPG